jgi:hypothetical protein
MRFHNPLANQAYAEVLAGVFGFHKKMGQYMSPTRVRDHPLLDFLNVRAVIVRKKHRIPKGLKRVATFADGQTILMRNPGALPRFFLAPSTEVVPETEIMESLVNLTDARRVLLAAEEVQRWRPSPRRWRPRAVRLVSYAPGDVVLQFPGKGEKLLATSLLNPGGWEAWSNGSKMRTLTINGAFLGVVAADGVGQLRLRFVPAGLRTGTFCLLGSVAFLLAIALGGRVRIRQ